MGSSYYLANKLLDLAFGATAWSPPSNLYVAKLLQDPQRDASAVLEPSSGGYSRITVANNLTNFPAAASHSKANAVAITGAAATGAQGTVTHIGWFDDDGTPSGNLISYQALPTPEVFDDPDVLNIPIGQYVASIIGAGGNTQTVAGDFLANELLDHWLGASVFTPPATLYAFYSYTLPTAAGGNITEPVGFAYARRAVTNNTTNFANASNGSKVTGAEIAFTAASGGSWGKPSYFGFMTASSGGSLYCATRIPNPRTINDGTIPRLPTGLLTIALT